MPCSHENQNNSGDARSMKANTGPLNMDEIGTIVLLWIQDYMAYSIMWIERAFKQFSIFHLIFNILKLSEKKICCYLIHVDQKADPCMGQSKIRCPNETIQ